MRWIPWALCLSAIMLTGACTETTSDLRPLPPSSQTTTKEPSAPHHARPQAELDEHKNLTQAPRRVYGYDLPLSAQSQRQGPAVEVLYVHTTENRLLRFYRSRGYAIRETASGWQISHSDRTLNTRKLDDSLRGAELHVNQGPGPGYTLRLLAATSVHKRQPALMKLLEAEYTQATPSDPTPTPTDTGTKTTEPKRSDLDTLRLKTLRNRALKPKASVNKKTSRDISRRIHRWSKEQSGARFLD